MTKAEEFKQKAAIARSKTPATLKYEALLEDIDQAAKAGMVALPQTKYTVEGLQYTRGMMGGAMLDYNKLYDEQEEIYDLLRKDGFDVRITDPELPSTLDINLTPEARERIEMTKRCIEKQVLIVWDPEEFDRP
jgi:hypothetical protein